MRRRWEHLLCGRYRGQRRGIKKPQPLFSPSAEQIAVVSLYLFRATPAAYGSFQARVKSDLQLLATATATPDQSGIFYLHCNSRQHWILDPLSETRDQIPILTDTMSGSKPTEPQWELLECFFIRQCHKGKQLYSSQLQTVSSSQTDAECLARMVTKMLLPWLGVGLCDFMF